MPDGWYGFFIHNILPVVRSELPSFLMSYAHTQNFERLKWCCYLVPGIYTWGMLYGYDSLVQSFKRLADARELSHAYLFFGEAQVGKFLHAHALANYLETGAFDAPTRILQETHVVTMEKNEDEESDTERMGIHAVHRAIHFLRQHPVFSPYRVVIVRDVGWLTDQAQNALLKILEEPPPQSIIILTVTDPGVCLPAVASRAQHIYFKTLSDGEMGDIMPKLDIPNRSGIMDKVSLIQSAFGRVGRLESLLHPTALDQEIARIASAIIAARTDTDRERIIDAMLALDQKDPRSTVAVCEALEITLLAAPAARAALAQTVRLITQLQTLTLSKRIHFKKLLCLIK